MFAKDERSGKTWIIETSRKCYITDLDLALKIIKSRLDEYKKSQRRDNLDSRPWKGIKRYLLNETERIGTLPKLTEELTWWLENDYCVSSITIMMSGQIIIEILSTRFNSLTQTL